MRMCISDHTWQRRGAHHATRTPRRKREHRLSGFLSPRQAAYRRLLKRTTHRHARRASRAALRAYRLVRAA